MYPILRLFKYSIGTYSICTGIGIIASALYIKSVAKKRTDLDSIQLINIIAVSGLGAFFGAHLLFALTKWQLLCDTIKHSIYVFGSIETLIKSFVDVFGGMVFYGGLIGGIATGFYYTTHLKHIHIDSLLYADIYAPAIPLFHAFGRIGCFLGGCCYGIESRWGFIYHSAPIPESNGVVRFPVQLVEAAGNIILFYIIHKLSKRDHSNGMILIYYIVTYSIMRFLLEFLRGDDIRGHIWKLSVSQWISILLLLSACIVARYIKERPR